jgi:hypothetical protein
MMVFRLGMRLSRLRASPLLLETLLGIMEIDIIV